MTRPNQGLSSLALGGGERETLGTRLAKFSFQKSVLGTPAALESVLGKSSAIPVCLSCLRYDVTRALCYCVTCFS